MTEVICKPAGAGQQPQTGDFVQFTRADGDVPTVVFVAYNSSWVVIVPGSSGNPVGWVMGSLSVTKLHSFHIIQRVTMEGRQ